MRSSVVVSFGTAGFVFLAACGGATDRQDAPDASIASTSSPAHTLSSLRAHPGIASALRDAVAIERIAGGFRPAKAQPATNGRWTRVATKLEVTLPASADAPARLQLPGDDSAWVEIGAADVASVAPTLDHDLLVYERAARDLDLVHVASERRFEELRVVRTAEAARAHRWSIRLGPAFTGVRVRDGHVEIVDAAGAVRIETDPLVAIDANGAKRALVLEAKTSGDAATIDATLDPDGLALPIVVDPAWTATGSMVGARNWAAYGLLSSGNVIVAGGNDAISGSTPISTAEVWSPSTGTWTSIKAMPHAHSGALGFALPGSKFLVADISNGVSELWDGTSWTTLAMIQARQSGGAAVWMGGTVDKVLVTGGFTGSTFLSAAEVFDGTSWKSVTPSSSTHCYHGLAWLPKLGTSGRAVAAGGTASTAEFYDPATNSWTAAPSMPTSNTYYMPGVTLQDGRALLLGGAAQTSFLFDGSTWTNVYDPQPHTSIPGVVLASGKVLSPPYILDPANPAFNAGGTMLQPRTAEALVALGDGRAIAAGGSETSTGNILATAEIYSPVSNGGACTTAGECASGFCSESTCCASACTSPCQACDVSSSLGTCTNVTGAPHGTKTCGAYVCNGSGPSCPTTCSTDANCASGYWCKSGQCIAKSAQGAACPTGSHECANGLCIDGYCCNASCTQGCQACDVAGSLGTCSNVTSGAPHGTRDCSGMLCNATSAPACPTVCQQDTDCVSGDFCDNKVCYPKKAVGQACPTGDHECTNGTCVDGYCCTSTCTASCQACDVGGSLGTCANVTGAPHGSRSSCAPYACQGSSASCPTSCASDAGCASGDWCSGTTCVALKTNGQTCPTGAHECQSGLCVDGVCCNAACTGECEACDVGGSVGTCTPVSGAPHGGRTPCGGTGFCQAQCDGSNRTACGAYPGLSTVCAAASCSSGSSTPTRYCDGAGSCATVSSTTCAPYVCNGTTACKTSCSGDADCASGYHCSGTTCVTNGGLGTYCTSGTQCTTGTFCTNNACCNVSSCPTGTVCNANGSGTCSKPLGATCTGNADCGSGNCVDGVCCNTACTGQCEACNVGGSLGTCVPVSGAPKNGRPACGGTGTCQAQCDGSTRTACGAYPGTSTICAAATCSSGSTTPTRYCDGLGGCATISPTSCAPYVCGGSACKTSCATDGDCVTGDFCQGTSCISRLALGNACSAGTQCQSGNCVDGVCCSAASCAAPLKCNVAGAAGSCSKPLGAVCSSNAECGGGHCVDGYCCNGGCTGQCEACDVSGSEGTCSPVAGAPHGLRMACLGTGPCQARCDGAVRTACGAPPGPSTVCATASCSAGEASAPSYCDGLGGCTPATPTACAPYQCGGAACKTSCSATATDCASGYACKAGACVTTGDLGTLCTDDTQCKSGHCTSAGGGNSVCCASATCPTGSVCADATTTTPGACVKQAGQTCAASSDCQSGFCVDGVCCESLCSGQCEACDAAGAVGKCTPIDGAPHGSRAACSDGAGDVCKALSCNGGSDRTKCVGYANGPATQCKPASCVDGTATEASFCDGNGSCKDGSTKACVNYACGATACLTKCATSSDCSAGFVCDASSSKCVPPAAATCSQDGLSSISPDGTQTTPCAPFRCDPSNGQCYASCTSSDQCGPGNNCDGAKCSTAADASATPSSGGCDVKGGGAGKGAGSAIAFAAIALVLARRRRVA